MNYSIFKSRTAWVLVLTFLVNGYAAISGQVPAGVNVIVNAVLAIVAGYFHVNPSQSYSQ